MRYLEQRTGWRDYAERAGYAVLFALVAVYAFAPIFSVDFFWHLKLGEIIATRGAIARTDLFSAIRPERAYVQFQWLWELGAYAVFRRGDLVGVRVMQVASLLLGYAILANAVRRFFASKELAFCFCCLAIVLFEDRFQARPSATILAFLALTLPWLWGGHRQVKWKDACLAFVLGTLWSNIHGGESLLWVGCLGALLVGSIIEWRLGERTTVRELRSTLQLAAFGLAGVICSPTLIPGLLDWARVIGPQIRSGNQEWQPCFSILSHGVNASTLLVGLGPSAVAIAYTLTQWRSRQAFRPAAWPWSEWFLCAGLLVLAHQAVRNAFLSLVPLSFILLGLDLRRFNLGIRMAVITLGLGLLAASFEDHVIEGYGSPSDALALIRYDVAPATFPEELASFMREANIQGGIMNDGRWGGYLIWKLWPSCHVAVDSRHHLTAEMWPVFMASQNPDQRDAVLEYAFKRWGLELSAFRGPTFAAVLPSSSHWQLLYKAGDQELYQHRQGRHAALNLDRASRWLSAQRGDKVPDQRLDSERLTREAMEVGASRWLAAPFQRYREQKAHAFLSSRDREKQYQGLTIQSALQFDAGQYPGALATLQQILKRRPDDPTALYRTLLASLAIGDTSRALFALERIRSDPSGLTVRQLRRIAAIYGMLSSVSPNR